jgi:Tol biopolymer transport system component
VVAQGGGLPALHRLDWGIPDVLYAVWSPDGRWIAAMGGPDAGTVHLEVVSPDGGKRIDLSGWHCGSADGLWGIAWLPDNRLSCFAADAPLYRMCIGAEPFASCLPVALPTALRTSPQEGAVWSPDGRYLLLPAPIRQGYRTDLFVLSRAGRITQILPFAAQGGFGNPQWSADGTRLFYNRFFEVVDRAASLSADGNLTLGPARLLVSDCASEDAGDHVAWSPSRRWLAANCIVDSQFREESVFLISTAHQASATAIVRVQQDGHGMLFPMWSPDGQTLIVFGWADGRPYAVDIGAYLRGKGLSP